MIYYYEKTCRFGLKLRKMEKKELNLRIAFDILDADGTVLPLMDKYPNGFIIPLDADEVTHKDCFAMEWALIHWVQRLAINKHLGHLFCQPPATDPKELYDIIRRKGKDSSFEVSLARIELKESHSSGLSLEQAEQ
jgi:hypothetical protein